MFTSQNGQTQNYRSKKTALIQDQKQVSFNTLIYILNEYSAMGHNKKKTDSLEKLGEDVGARLYEGIFFTTQNLSSKKEERKLKIVEMMNYIRYSLWPVLFDKTAGGIEIFTGSRKHKLTNADLKEYVIYDLDPVYNLRYANNTNVTRYLCGILKGFLTYAGFPCTVGLDVPQDKDKRVKFDFIISFDESVLDNEM